MPRARRRSASRAESSVRSVRPLFRETWLRLTIRVFSESWFCTSATRSVPGLRSISRITIPRRSRSTYQGMTFAGCSVFEMTTSSPGLQSRLQATMEIPSEVEWVSATSSSPAPNTRASWARRSGSIRPITPATCVAAGLRF